MVTIVFHKSSKFPHFFSFRCRPCARLSASTAKECPPLRPAKPCSLKPSPHPNPPSAPRPCKPTLTSTPTPPYPLFAPRFPVLSLSKGRNTKHAIRYTQYDSRTQLLTVVIPKRSPEAPQLYRTKIPRCRRPSACSRGTAPNPLIL